MSRREQALSFEFQPRDGELLRGLYDSRLMTLGHAALLYFAGSREAAKKRIQKLKAAGLVAEKTRKAYKPSIIFLTEQGYAVIRDRGLLHHAPALGWTRLEKRLQVSELTMRHELEIVDVKAAVSSAILGTSNYVVAEFTTWPLLSQFYASPNSGPEILVKPDGFIRIREQNADGAFEHTFFLEVDRSTETLDTLARRALCYLDFYQRGGLAERFGRPRSEYKDFPFRVLMIFKTAERRNNIAERLLIQRPPILTQAWLSTLTQVMDDPLGAIWIRPRDYREATNGTPYMIGAAAAASYQRHQAREQLVESLVCKHRMLTSESPNMETIRMV